MTCTKCGYTNRVPGWTHCCNCGALRCNCGDMYRPGMTCPPCPIHGRKATYLPAVYEPEHKQDPAAENERRH